MSKSSIVAAALSPRADSLLLRDSRGSVENWSVDNKHPDISWDALWSEIWYESYPQPEYVWQSSAANNDFEPKYSFAPLAFGTLKAAFVEAHLVGVFSLLVFMPVGVLLFAYLWSSSPLRIRSRVPDGWQAMILIPVVCTIEYSCFAANDLVVGIAMGLAVIPTIFSIAEDAIFAVPRHFSYGSLALGATPWQTLVGVVLPTASPGIFSGLMIGLGRAVGETMVVLMATGNTPIMDANIFEGMRTYPFVHLDQKFMHLGFHIYDVGFQSPNVEAARPLVYATALLLVAIIALLNLGRCGSAQQATRALQSA